MKLYMKCTKDKYELPLIVEDSIQTLANKAGVTVGAVSSMISKHIGGYHRIEIEDDLSDTEKT